MTELPAGVTRADIRAAAARLGEFIDSMEALEPHVLLQTDPQTGVRTALGPYASRDAALAAIPDLRAEWLQTQSPPMAVWEPVVFLPIGDEEATS